MFAEATLGCSTISSAKTNVRDDADVNTKKSEGEGESAQPPA